MARFFLRQLLTSYSGLRRVQQNNRSRVLAKIPYSCNTFWRHVSAVMSFISSQRSAFWRNLYIYIYIYIYLIAWAHRGDIILDGSFITPSIYCDCHAREWWKFLKHYLGVDEIMINNKIFMNKNGVLLCLYHISFAHY